MCRQYIITGKRMMNNPNPYYAGQQTEDAVRLLFLKDSMMKTTKSPIQYLQFAHV